ncbi:MAG: response regulator transcription factor [Alkalispirochaeta sp.]
MAGRVLVVDDQKAILDLLEFILSDYGYEVRCAARGDVALDVAAEWTPDVVILDLGLPGTDGLEVCRRLHSESIPVLVLSSHDQDDEVVEGLQEGADDYVTKPFNHRELMLRIEKLMQRNMLHDSPVPIGLIRIRELEIDPARREVRHGTSKINLTPTEYRVLELLAQTPGRPVDVETILARVWKNSQWEGGYEMIKVNIRRLRRKIEPDPSNPTYIINRRGVGYILAE